MPKLSKIRGLRYFGHNYDFVYPFIQELREKHLEHLEIYTPTPILNNGFLHAACAPQSVSIHTLTLVDRPLQRQGNCRINIGYWKPSHINPLLKSIKDLKRLVLRAGESPQRPDHGRFDGIWERLGDQLMENLEELVLEYPMHPDCYHYRGYGMDLSVVRLESGSGAKHNSFPDSNRTFCPNGSAYTSRCLD